MPPSFYVCDTPAYVQALVLIQQTTETLQSQPIDQTHATLTLPPSTLAILLELCPENSGSVQFGDGLSWSARWELDSATGTLIVRYIRDERWREEVVGTGLRHGHAHRSPSRKLDRLNAQ